MSEVGILMPLFSLPSKHYIGDMGPCAYRFVDMLKRANISIWQLLPLNPVSYGNSPYQPFSSFACEISYISLELLSIEIEVDNTQLVDYQMARDLKTKVLRDLFINQCYDLKKFEDFKSENSWLDNYALFMCLKNKNGDSMWNEWTDFEVDNSIDFIKFMQYVFFEQFTQLRDYANKNGVKLMGDIPFYVGYDSCDVWECQKNFDLSSNKTPNYVAGVAPDYFSTTGQRWGNPLYRYDILKQNNYKFLVDRIKINSKLYDILRIDHFRAFESYYKIPYNFLTAEHGIYQKAPGHDILKAIKSNTDIEIVVEDLGFITKEVYQLRDEFDFPGMNIIEFFENFDSCVEYNSVTYTSTHDNQTLKGWFDGLNNDVKKKIEDYFIRNNYSGNTHSNLISYALNSRSKYVILSVQDVMCLSDEARINKPGIVDDINWKWRFWDLDSFEMKLSMCLNNKDRH